MTDNPSNLGNYVTADTTSPKPTPGIDPDVWSARAVNDKLNTDMRVRGGTWPDHIANPGAFLYSRLRRLSWTPPEPTTKAGGSAAVSIDQTPTPVVLTDASRARIAAAQQEIRQVLRDRAQRTHEDARQQHLRRAITSTSTLDGRQPSWRRPPAATSTHPAAR
ncbi:hypothetical protein [Mycolicibacterium llatzerense]|uniref:hypothetical protein n=1 Tax=Mycolicibacterium llatzerense TaxID=280871 RepID=UPI000ABC6948|nr:hypothetical protein [Mycolicibacterium llatzerense]